MSLLAQAHHMSSQHHLTYQHYLWMGFILLTLLALFVTTIVIFVTYTRSEGPH